MNKVLLFFFSSSCRNNMKFALSKGFIHIADKRVNLQICQAMANGSRTTILQANTPKDPQSNDQDEQKQKRCTNNTKEMIMTLNISQITFLDNIKRN